MTVCTLHSDEPVYALTVVTADVGAYTYGLGHPMKPQRMRMTHELVSVYGMLDKMDILVRYMFCDSATCAYVRSPSESETCHRRTDDQVPYG